MPNFRLSRRSWFLLLTAILVGVAVGIVATGRIGRTIGPLFAASTAGQAKDALARGADVNAHDRDGRTPLHFAAARCLPEVVEVLIQAGGNFKASTPSGERPLSLAVQELIDPDEGYDVGDVTPGDRLVTVELLLKAGADTNSKETSGRTPLFHAARNPALLKRLLDAGADATVVDVDGYSPLHEAAIGGNAEAVRMLIAHGAQVNARDKWEHRTPLKMATDGEVRQLLVDAGGK
jgi:ankyrin repeat protein